MKNINFYNGIGKQHFLIRFPLKYTNSQSEKMSFTLTITIITEEEYLGQNHN